MNKLATLTLLLGAASAAPFALAGPAAPVTPRHRAGEAVHRLAAPKTMTGSASGKFQGDKPVTRYELALTLDRLVRYMEAGRKPLSAGGKQNPVKLPAHANMPTQQALSHLAQGGFIGAKSPLLQGNKIVTARELQDILAQVVIRLSDRNLPLSSH